MLKTVQATENQLTAKQVCFVNEYLIDLNATQAAIRAGYSTKTAEQMGYQLLQKTSVSAAIKSQQEQRAQRTKRSADSVLHDLQAVKDAAMRFVTDKDGNQIMANPNAALRALELEGKHLSMWIEKQQGTPENDIGAAITALIAKLPN
jgi:phage terminase small subunit